MVYKTPGVKIEEIRKLPPSIAAVETAIPVFIGYTEFAKENDNSLVLVPKRIRSLFDYERFFGTAKNEEDITVTFTTTPAGEDVIASKGNLLPQYLMYYALQAFFDNGGGPCWIISVGGYGDTFDLTTLQAGLAPARKVDEITLILFPDSVNLPTGAEHYNLQNEALEQCVALQDRFVIMDTYRTPNSNDPIIDDAAELRLRIGNEIDTIKYGAAYFPFLETFLDFQYDGTDVVVTKPDGSTSDLSAMKSGAAADNARYNQARAAIGSQLNVLLPPSSSMAGIYARVDNARGVWKAPANVSVSGALRPDIKVNDQDQRDLNVDAVSGKSINAIRSFTGRGAAIVWGARTLAGNDNEWRYISVRRFFNMVEESSKNATVQFVFEPNDKNTWILVKSMISNFLTLQWRAGALMGASPDEAYFVKVGLGETMSEQDILEGRMNVEIGMAVVRPAEFIILKFSHKMLSES